MRARRHEVAPTFEPALICRMMALMLLLWM